MCQIIGICGHRGAGKSSIGWLLGNCLEELYVGHELNQQLYNDWVDEVMKNPTCYRSADLRFVCFHEFQDQILIPFSLLTGIQIDKLYDRNFTRNTAINLGTFELSPRKKVLSGIIEDTDDLIQRLSQRFEPYKFTDSEWMVLEKFILYYGMQVMQFFVGENVWINSLRRQPLNQSTPFQIFTDAKTKSEQNYIIENGILLRVHHASHRKDKTIECDDMDIYSKTRKLFYDGDLYSLYEKITTLAKQIFNEYEQHNQN